MEWTLHSYLSATTPRSRLVDSQLTHLEDRRLGNKGDMLIGITGDHRVEKLRSVMFL